MRKEIGKKKIKGNQLDFVIVKGYIMAVKKEKIKWLSVQFMSMVTNYMWKHREGETEDGAES